MCSATDPSRQQEEGATPSRPAGVTVMSMFFALGAVIAFTAAVSLAVPDSPLESMWRLNPRARAEFINLGSWSAALMLAVSISCAVSALGLWRGTPWGHAVALTMLVINLVGDVANVLLGLEPRAVVGIPIVGVLIAYLMTRRVRWFFASPKVER